MPFKALVAGLLRCVVQHRIVSLSFCAHPPHYCNSWKHGTTILLPDKLRCVFITRDAITRRWPTTHLTGIQELHRRARCTLTCWASQLPGQLIKHAPLSQRSLGNAPRTGVGQRLTASARSAISRLAATAYLWVRAPPPVLHSAELLDEETRCQHRSVEILGLGCSCASEVDGSWIKPAIGCDIAGALWGSSRSAAAGCPSDCRGALLATRSAHEVGSCARLERFSL